MGTTREETGLPKVRNRTPFPVIYYPILILSTLTGFALGSNAYTQSTINNTLKLCNQKPLECKFKYDMVIYQETGRVPYTTQPIKK
jgi:hypothetical protein